MRGWLMAATAGFVITSFSGCSSSSEGSAAQGGEALPLEVKTVEGPVRGATKESSDTSEASDAKMVRTFLGIPYAAPPTGARRWKKPEPVTAWTETRDATAYGKRCPQPTTARAPNMNETDEDCLSLNVFTPAKKKSGEGAMPVMVWIHGGAFTTGSSRDDFYEASKLVAATGAMIVTINYRLGVLGFLAHPSLGANFGLYDQKAALEWVQRNASAFGGDPKNVTIFGESAGSQSVGLLATAPETANKGLFHRAVCQSGATGLLKLLDMDQGAKEAGDLARAVSCAEADFDCLRSKPANDLVIALGHTAETQPIGGLLQGSIPAKPWVPIADGAIAVSLPNESFENGIAAKVPYIIGTTKEEGGLFHTGLLGDKKLGPSDDYVAVVKRWLGDEQGARVAERYPLTAFGGDANKALARIDTLAFFVCPSRVMARSARDAGHPVFVYQLARAPNGGLTSSFGAVHAVDLVFLFDSDTGTTGRAGDEARDLVAGMQGYWGSFAMSGAPAHDGAPAWPAFAADEKHVVLDVPMSIGDALEKDECDFWDTVPQPALPPTYAPPP
jgi:para-nitrobenzyl esterase